MTCVLCESSRIQKIQHQHWPAKYFCHCQSCDLIFLPAEFHASPEQEKSRYATHHNDLTPGYEKHLLQVIEPTLQFYPAQNFSALRVLDYGCGPGLQTGTDANLQSALTQLLRRQGLNCQIYDPYFQSQVPESQFDLIFCTEVVEHFREPLKNWQHLLGFLAEKSDSRLAVMTQFHQGPDHFRNWWYAKDFTHICFYNEKTFRWLADFFKLKIEVVADPVVLMSTQVNS